MEITQEHLLLNNNNEYKKFAYKLPLKLKLAFGVGHVLNDVCASMWFTYILIFFKSVLKFDARQAGFMVLAGQIADAVANPIVGYFSDKPSSSWYGRRKVWHLIGTSCILATYVFLFLPCAGCVGNYSTGMIIYFYFNIVVFQCGWAAVQISHLSLIPELTPDENDRTKLAAYRYCFTVLSSLFVYVTTWLALSSSEKENSSELSPADAPTFWNIAWAELSVGLLCSLIFQYVVKEKKNVEGNFDDLTQNTSGIYDIVSNVEYYKGVIIYMSTMLFVNLTQVYVPVFIQQTLKMPRSSLAIIPLIMYTGSFVMSGFVDKLNKHFGRKVSYTTGGVLAVTACMWMQIRAGCPDFINLEIYVVAVLLGFAGAIVLVTNLGITSDLIGDKTGSGAAIYSIMTVSDKLANGIAICVMENLQEQLNSPMLYQNLLVFFCGGAIILATISVISLKRPRARDLEEYIALP